MVSVKTPTSAKKVTGSEVPVLMLYHATWCGICQMFKKTWLEIKDSLEKEKGIEVADVEYDDMNNLPADLQDVRGFPTLRLLEQGVVIKDYTGPRTKEDIILFAIEHAKPEKAKTPKSKPTPKSASASKPKPKPKPKSASKPKPKPKPKSASKPKTAAAKSATKPRKALKG